ncbi:unnamed protein product, partial [marine sediment metagenome]
MISDKLKAKFEEVIEIRNIDWAIVEHVIQKDTNILRPIKGVAFEEYFKKILRNKYPDIDIKDGVGDSDVDIYVNVFKLQLKTPQSGSTRSKQQVGVALHKTHGNEKRPFNLYDRNNYVFEFLVVLHPESGIYIIPYKEIPEHKVWKGYLADPAIFEWNSYWLNKWSLIGLDFINNISIDNRRIPLKSELPTLSKETFLEDHEIIEMLCKPEYFRAAVMGLKGNIKEQWFIEYLEKLGYVVGEPTEAYSKYDALLTDKYGKQNKIQIKGTSK